MADPVSDPTLEQELALNIVSALLDLPADLDCFSQLDGAGLIWLDGVPAVSMTWTQTTLTKVSACSES